MMDDCTCGSCMFCDPDTYNDGIAIDNWIEDQHYDFMSLCETAPGEEN
jgi:hypothetical protein